MVTVVVAVTAAVILVANRALKRVLIFQTLIRCRLNLE